MVEATQLAKILPQGRSTLTEPGSTLKPLHMKNIDRLEYILEGPSVENGMFSKR